jgi:2-polyprenyl-6-methoxyphenol hydroxylase-like FAD-dependent oxidoreductase
MTHPRPVLIAGAGIGGLALGIALRRAGVPVAIYEKAARLKPLGWGLQLAPNGMRALRDLGLFDAALAAGQRIGRGRMLTPRGRVLKTLNFDALDARVGVPTGTINRGRLHQLLLEAFGADDVHVGAAATGFEDRGDHVALRLADGSVVEGALLVGADGVHSAIRKQQLGEAAPARYAGYTAWRGLSPRADLLPADEGFFTLGQGHRFGCAPLGDGHIYWFATYYAPAGEPAPADPHDLLQSKFGDWHAPVPQLIASTPTEDILRTDIFDREPTPGWSRGRVTLLGDAAHPMTPDLGQGACQALEDAIVLSRLLASETPVEAALKAYESQRFTRTREVVHMSRRMGQIEQVRNPVGRWLRDEAYALLPAQVALEQMYRLAIAYPGA